MAKYLYTWRSEPVIAPDGNIAGVFRLEHGWTIDRETADETDRRWVVPSGFLTDFASIPRFFWRSHGHPMDAVHFHAALLHDFRYSVGGTEHDRKEADKDYRRMLRQAGMSAVKAYAEYKAVRWFGKKHFNYEKRG